MDVRTYRAKSMQAALELVRSELGPDAAVLHARQLHGGLMRWLTGCRHVEVVASLDVNVPSRLPRRRGDNQSEAVLDRFGDP